MSTVSSTSLYGSTTNTKAIGGLASGLDTDTLVEQMTSATVSKISKQYQAQQKLVYQQEAYRKIINSLSNFNSTYFSYSTTTGSSVLNSSFFKAYSMESSSKYVSVIGDADNVNNFSISNISSVATKSSFASSKAVTSGFFSSYDLTDQYASSLAGTSMTINYGGTDYTLTLDKNFGRGNEAVELTDVAEALNEQIDKIADLNGGTNDDATDNKLIYSVDGNKLVLTNSDTTKTVKLTSASSAILNNLNMAAGSDAQSESEISEEQIAALSIETSTAIKDKNQYMTFDYNGVTKKINLTDTITDGNSLAAYLQAELNKAYGTNKVTASYDSDNNKLTFSAVGQNNLFGVCDISTDLKAVTGIDPTTYNRLNKTSAVTDAGVEGLDTSADSYKITINDIQFEFDKSMSMTDIMKEINNNSEAGVNVYYSSTTDTFTVKATETGSHKGVVIKDVDGGGNLASSLFGTSVNDLLQNGEFIKTEDGAENIYKIVNGVETKIGTANYDGDTKKYTIDYIDGKGTDITSSVDYKINQGTDTTMTYTMNGIETTVTRSTSNFSIDGVSISLNEKAVGEATDEDPITFTATNNTDEVVKRVKQFVDDYNEVLELISTAVSEKHNRDYAPLTPAQKEDMSEDEITLWEAEAKKGMLYGDSMLRNLLSNLRGAVSSRTSGTDLILSNIGISAASYDTSGKLTFDEDKFVEMLTQNPDDITALFTEESTNVSGIAVQIKSILKENIGNYGYSGILVDRAGADNSTTTNENYLSDRIEEYDDKLADLKEKLEDERTRYWKKFSNLETTLNNLNSQSSWLTNMLGS
nr:flagellar filament capping protein FliD [Sedimentibacter sp.]